MRQISQGLDPVQLLLVMSFMVAIFSAIFFLIIISIKLKKEKDNKPMRQLIIIMDIIYLMSINYASTIFIFCFYPDIFAIIKPLHHLSIVLFPVLFYHFTYSITVLNIQESVFNKIHYLCALVFFAVLAMVKNENTEGVKFYLIILYYGFYLFLSIRKIIYYRKNINDFSSNFENTSIRWIMNILIIQVIILVSVLLFHFLLKDHAHKIPGIITLNYILMVFHVVLCYNIFRENFTFIYADEIVLQDKEKEEDIKENLDQEAFEKYMEEEKPYLNPYLKITDLILPLATNRTYFSSFINNTYGVNFSVYINTLRLKEFYYLKQLPENIERTDDDLIYLSGFRSRSSYNRIKDLFEKEKGKFGLS
ncbi:hypothetical protein VO54_03708 [Elizabethkingia miricola]|nr:hypothetical protein VO54_03708 [Elizabethkingia miricola]